MKNLRVVFIAAMFAFFSVAVHAQDRAGVGQLAQGLLNVQIGVSANDVITINDIEIGDIEILNVELDNVLNDNQIRVLNNFINNNEILTDNQNILNNLLQNLLQDGQVVVGVLNGVVYVLDN